MLLFLIIYTIIITLKCVTTILFPIYFNDIYYLQKKMDAFIYTLSILGCLESLWAQMGRLSHRDPTQGSEGQRGTPQSTHTPPRNFRPGTICGQCSTSL